MSLFTNLTLRGKITLLALVCLLSGIGVLRSPGIRALNHATDTMLQECLTTAGLVAAYVDEVLLRAFDELKSTAQTIHVNEAESNLQQQVQALESTYSLCLFTFAITVLRPKAHPSNFPRPNCFCCQ